MIRGFEMKKKCDKLLGILCYALGILAALYVGGYLMLIKQHKITSHIKRR